MTNHEIERNLQLFVDAAEELWGWAHIYEPVAGGVVVGVRITVTRLRGGSLRWSIGGKVFDTRTMSVAVRAFREALVRAELGEG